MTAVVYLSHAVKANTPRTAAGTDLVAAGNPQLPQGFYPLPQAKRLYPGETLTVTCEFDSSAATQVVHAGPTHANEMCNMYLMLAAPLTHLAMCNTNGWAAAGDGTPGNMPRRGRGRRWLAGACSLT